MHIIKKYESSVTLFSATGDVIVFKSMKAAYDKLGLRWILKNVGEHFRQFSHLEHRVVEGEYIYTPRFIECPYVMRNDLGDKITGKDFDYLQEKGRSRYFWVSARLEKWNGEGPVPGTGKDPAGSHCYRWFRYVGAMRQSIHVQEDGEPSVRAKRSLHLLPNAWDDKMVKSREIKNWKQFRRHQWR